MALIETLIRRLKFNGTLKTIQDILRIFRPSSIASLHSRTPFLRKPFLRLFVEIVRSIEVSWQEVKWAETRGIILNNNALLVGIFVKASSEKKVVMDSVVSIIIDS